MFSPYASILESVLQIRLERKNVAFLLEIVPMTGDTQAHTLTIRHYDRVHFL